MKLLGGNKLKSRFVIQKIPANAIIVVFVCVLLFGVGSLLHSRLMLMIGLFGAFFSSVLILRKESYFAVAFLISFFTFLMGRILINAITGETSLIKGAFIYDSGPSDKQLLITLTLLFVSVIIFSYSVLLTPKQKINYINFEIREKNNGLEYACIIIFYITIIFEFVVSIEKFMFTYIGGSYTGYYISFARKLPPFVYKIAELNLPAFFSVLAFCPPKRDTKPIIFLYLLDGFIVLLAGQRNQLVRAALICFCYVLLRNKWDNDDNWLSKKQLRTIIIALPFLIVALQAWGTMRNGSVFNINGIFNAVGDFFRDQGTTSVVIYEGVELQNSFPVGVNYTFAPIVNFLLNNQITKLFYHTVLYTQQTTELALYGNNFGATLTYLYVPYNYSEGIGMGSSYVIEVFHDFGWLGVSIINILYGFLLVRLERYFSKPIKSPWVGMILLLFADGILYAPRDSALNFLTNALNFTVLLYVILVYVIAAFIKVRKA